MGRDLIILKSVNSKISDEDLKTMRRVEEAWKDIEEGRYGVLSKEAFFKGVAWLGSGTARVRALSLRQRTTNITVRMAAMMKINDATGPNGDALPETVTTEVVDVTPPQDVAELVHVPVALV